MIEDFEKGSAINEARWKEHIISIQKSVVPSSKLDVKNAIVAAVKKRVPKGRFGVFLSGGVDSSLLAVLAKKFSDDFICYSVGTKESSDLIASEVVAKKFNLERKVRVFNDDEVLALLKRSKAIVPKKDVVHLGVGAVVIAACELAKKDGITTFFGGLGSEEIFAGYHRHLNVPDVNDECWKGLLRLPNNDLARDFALGSALKVSVLVPFLDADVIRTAMGISGDKKISAGMKKVILREIADEFDIPKEISWRKKLAAQYGSGFDKVLERFAKKAKVTKGEFVDRI